MPRRSEESVSVPNNELGALSSLLSETAADASSTYQNNLHALVATLSEQAVSAPGPSCDDAYPAVHYAVLTAIAASIVLAYLVETDQEVLQFLSSLQLRLLFTILIGVFSGVGSVVTDIADRFEGVPDHVHGRPVLSIAGGGDLRRRVQADDPRRPRVAAGERARPGSMALSFLCHDCRSGAFLVRMVSLMRRWMAGAFLCHRTLCARATTPCRARRH